ncbi:rCG53389, partial [Rattus norvegicus]
MLLKCHII